MRKITYTAILSMILANPTCMSFLRAQEPSAPPSAKTITMTEDQLRQIIREEVRKEIQSLARQNNDARAVALANSAASTIQTVQSQIELYKIQHNDRAPTLRQLRDNWGVLLKKTDRAANIVANGEFGPYLRSAPPNPFNGKSTIVARSEASPLAGWTYDEASGSVRLIAPDTIDLARFPAGQFEVISVQGEADRLARFNSAASTVQTIASQSELYKIQHADRYPTLAQLKDNWSVLIKPTDMNGNPASGARAFGPYLQQQPVNPYTGKSSVVAAGQPSADAGWTYDEKTGRFKVCLPRSIANELNARELNLNDLVESFDSQPDKTASNQ